MTQAEFNALWHVYVVDQYVGPPNDGPGSVSVGIGSASFLGNDDGGVGISQSLATGLYNISLYVSGGFDSTHYFILSTNNNRLLTITSPGVYTLPVNIINNIQLLWTGSGASQNGILSYIRAEAPQTLHTNTVYTIYGTLSRANSDGKEAYTGELGGTQLQITTGEQFPNPFLNYMYVSSSLIQGGSIFNPGGSTSQPVGPGPSA